MKEKENIAHLPPFVVQHVVSQLSETIDWGLRLLKVPDTWKITKGAGITVLIVDTGMPKHKDLDGAILTSQCKNFVNHENTIEDLFSGHSTHCSGIVGARENNMGMVGVAPECNIVTYRVLDNSGSGGFEGIAAALEYAADQLKPDVISMSLGSPAPDDKTYAAIKKLHKMNIPCIVAAGNDGEAESVNYPGSYDEVITVASIDSFKELSKFNSMGDEIDILAPGQEIYSTYLRNAYARLSGTSMATPFIAGIVALMLAKHKKQEKETGLNDCKTVDQIKEHLIKYAEERTYKFQGITYKMHIINPFGTLSELDIDEIQKPVEKLTKWQKFLKWFRDRI